MSYDDDDELTIPPTACPCGGVRQPTGEVVSGPMPRYPHRCTSCGRAALLWDIYPAYLYRGPHGRHPRHRTDYGTGEGVPLASLPDEELVAESRRMLDDAAQAELDELLYRNRENELTGEERARLDELMGAVGQGLVRKAEAIKLAVERGLIPPLSYGEGEE